MPQFFTQLLLINPWNLWIKGVIYLTAICAVADNNGQYLWGSGLRLLN